LVPKRHVECIGAMEKQEADKLESLADFARGVLFKEYNKPSIIFEHGIVGQTIKHAHMHIVPADVKLLEKITKDFPMSGTSYFSSLSSLCHVYSILKRPYLLWRDFAWINGIIWDPPAPLQYLRIVVADALGRPERANWRTMDPELDKKLWSETVRRLKPYFETPH